MLIYSKKQSVLATMFRGFGTRINNLMTRHKAVYNLSSKDGVMKA